MIKVIKAGSFAAEVEKELLEEHALNESAVQYLIHSIDSRLKKEKRQTFFIQSESLECGFYVKKISESKIVIKDIVPGDLYYNTGMLTRKLTEFIKDKEAEKDDRS